MDDPRSGVDSTLQCTAIRIGIVVYEPPLVRPQKEWLYNLGGMQGDL